MHDEIDLDDPTKAKLGSTTPMSFFSTSRSKSKPPTPPPNLDIDAIQLSDLSTAPDPGQELTPKRRKVLLYKPFESASTISVSTLVLFVVFFVLAFFPSLFHALWSLPLSLLSSIISPSHSSSSNTYRSPPASAYIKPHNLPRTMWYQKTFTLPSKSRGSYLITDTVLKELPELKSYKVGLLNLFIQHTSCALSLNENWDEDVRADMSDALDRIAPEDESRDESLYRHSAEGKDDMPAHIKSALIGASVTIPIRDGKLATGTWQGIWYLEFRASKHQRRVVATIQGEKA